MMPPEQVDSWLLPPEDLSLRGGLKGRLAGEICLLETSFNSSWSSSIIFTRRRTVVCEKPDFFAISSTLAPISSIIWKP